MLENDDEERDLDKKTEFNAKQQSWRRQAKREDNSNSNRNRRKGPMITTSGGETSAATSSPDKDQNDSESASISSIAKSTKKFTFNPDAPAFVPSSQIAYHQPPVFVTQVVPVYPNVQPTVIYQSGMQQVPQQSSYILSQSSVPPPQFIGNNGGNSNSYSLGQPMNLGHSYNGRPPSSQIAYPQPPVFVTHVVPVYPNVQPTVIYQSGVPSVPQQPGYNLGQPNVPPPQFIGNNGGNSNSFSRGQPMNLGQHYNTRPPSNYGDHH